MIPQQNRKNLSGRKVTHFKTNQTKGRRVLLHVLDEKNIKLEKMLREEHIVKLNKCDEKFLFLTKLFSQLSNKTSGEVCWNNIDLRNAYRQLMQFSIMGGETSGTYISITTRRFEK